MLITSVENGESDSTGLYESIFPLDVWREAIFPDPKIICGWKAPDGMVRVCELI